MRGPHNNTKRSISAVSLLRWFVCSLLIAATISTAFAQPAIPEYKLKSVFLFRFTEYVDWPKSAFGDNNAPFVIGIYGSDPFGSFMDETVQGESVKGRAVQVRRFQSLDEITKCNMLFVGASVGKRVPEILAKVQGRPILTVSDIPDFAKRGGMIRFTKNGAHIGFRINVEAAKQAHLTISAKLLQVAEIVSTAK